MADAGKLRYEGIIMIQLENLFLGTKSTYVGNLRI